MMRSLLLLLAGLLACNAQKFCTVPSGGSNTTDDTPGIYAAIQNCSSGATIQFPSGTD